MVCAEYSTMVCAEYSTMICAEECSTMVCANLSPCVAPAALPEQPGWQQQGWLSPPLCLALLQGNTQGSPGKVALKGAGVAMEGAKYIKCLFNFLMDLLSQGPILGCLLSENFQVIAFQRRTCASPGQIFVEVCAGK